MEELWRTYGKIVMTDWLEEA